MQDYYKVLNISSNANTKEIKKAFQIQSLLYHPDKSKSEIDKFIMVQRAYETLSDEMLRQEYDKLLVYSNKMGAIQDELRLDEMFFENDQYSYECRCGGEYIVTEDALEQGVAGIECSRCSLCVRLL
jgi:diphthamide biosynthesis protein 4